VAALAEALDLLWNGPLCEHAARETAASPATTAVPALRVHPIIFSSRPDAPPRRGRAP
jgi:hypothetical protein